MFLVIFSFDKQLNILSLLKFENVTSHLSAPNRITQQNSTILDEESFNNLPQTAFYIVITCSNLAFSVCEQHGCQKIVMVADGCWIMYYSLLRLGDACVLWCFSSGCQQHVSTKRKIE